MKLHSIFVSNKNNLTTLMVKDLASFCYLCIDRNGFDCPNLHWTSDQVPKVLQLVDTRSVCMPMYDDQDQKWDYSVDGSVLAIALEIGDNFVMNTKAINLEGVDFQVFFCTKPMHIMKKSFIDKWGTYFVASDDVVAGLYYQRWGIGERNYVLLKDSHVVYMLSNMVCVVKFLMPPKEHRVSGNDVVYEMNKDTLNGIQFVIVVLDDDE